MKLILTCDDGYRSEGFLALLRGTLRATRGEDVEILPIPPEEERSASSHSLTFFKPVYLKRATLEVDGEDVEVLVTDGTPADNVLISLSHLISEASPDEVLVLSGVNRGANLGYDIHYSGTVSAALEATVKGALGVAFSLAQYENPDYEGSTLVVEAALRAILKLRAHPGFKALRTSACLNVNVPPGPPDSYKGVMLTRAGVSRYNDRALMRVNPRGQRYIWIGGDYPWGLAERGTDFWAIREGYISVTPIDVNPTWHKLLPDEGNEALNWLESFSEMLWKEMLMLGDR